MKRVQIGNFLIALLLPASANADLIVSAGDHVLDPNLPGQTRNVLITGGDTLDGVNLNLQVADGGPPAAGSIVGPKITAVDIIGVGTVFANDNNGQGGGEIVPQVWGGVGTLSLSQVIGEGVLARVTFDTTGLVDSDGPWPFLLKNTLNGDSVLLGASAAVTINDGSLSIIPEPSSFGLLICVATGFGLAAIKPWSRASRRSPLQ